MITAGAMRAGTAKLDRARGYIRAIHLTSRWLGVPAKTRRYVVAAGLLLVGVIVVAIASQGDPARLAEYLLIASALAAVSVGLLWRPWLAPWAILLVFPVTAELQLRVTSLLGLSKDGLVGLLLIATVFQLRKRPQLRARLRPLRAPFGALGVLGALYLLDPGGTYGSEQFFGARLLLEGFCLLFVGLLCARPERAVTYLVRALCIVVPFEAVYAWIQQAAGIRSLVLVWGYAYGSQVRQTSSGALRTSGTFADPFQLAALAVLGVCVAAFLASPRQAIVLLSSALAILAATSVRTAFIQVALVGVVFALHRRWFIPTAAVLAALAAAGVFAGLVITSTQGPGTQAEPLLIGLNGRSTAWSLAVTDAKSFVVGHGVGVLGSGSERSATGLLAAAPRHDANQAPAAVFAGNSGFLDSTYAQVESDVGVAGTAALLIWLFGTLARLRRPLRAGETPRQSAARWGAVAVLSSAALDWIGRTSLASYTTGFLTLYILGLLLGVAAHRGKTEPRPVRRVALGRMSVSAGALYNEAA